MNSGNCVMICMRFFLNFNVAAIPSNWCLRSFVTDKNIKQLTTPKAMQDAVKKMAYANTKYCTAKAVTYSTGCLITNGSLVQKTKISSFLGIAANRNQCTHHIGNSNLRELRSFVK